MKKLLLPTIMLILAANLFAQIQVEGTPYSFDKRISDKHVSLIKMPAVDKQSLIAEDAINDLIKDIPWRFGHNFEFSYNVLTNGSWDILPDGSRILRMRIESDDALSINIAFDDFYLPAQTQLYIYNKERTHVIGAFSAHNNNQERKFATTLVKGNSIIIEYNSPAHITEVPALSISRITHGYRDAYQYASNRFRSSGACNINVACTQAQGWENEIRSACMLVVGGSGFCSGALVNNTAEDGKPYILTAHHCSSSNDFAQWVFWFNYQSPTCAPPTTTPSYNSVAGSTLRARNSTSDFCLVEMNQTPPANYNVFHSGWSRIDTSSIYSVCIHHPSGDIKKFSKDYNPSISAKYMDNQGLADSHWKVFWNEGTTEGGSSGSPLYDQNHRIIGQLHGGWASCSNPTAADFYGKFSTSWDYGTAASTRLKEWLDPNETGLEVLDGNDYNSPAHTIDISMSSILSPIEEYCGEIITILPSIQIRNNGSATVTNMKIRYGILGQTLNTYNWTGNLSFPNAVNINLPDFYIDTPGQYTFIAYSEMPNGLPDENPVNDTLKKVFSINQGRIVNLSLKTDNYADESSWKLFSEDYSTVVYQSSTLNDVTQYNINWCLPAGDCFHYVIYDSYGDGLSGSWGTPPGNYSITFLDSIFGSGSGDFGYSDTISFCVPDYSNVSETNFPDNSLNVFPNPANEFITIAGHPEESTIFIRNISGQEVFRKNINTNSPFSISFKDIQPGMYFLTVEAENYRQTRKLIIMKP